MSTLVSAINQWSCGLACIEAILADNKIQKTQNDILQNHNSCIPKWATHPGLMSCADFETVFRTVGFPVKVVKPLSPAEVIKELADANTIGAVMWVSKFWENPFIKNALVDLDHALRLVSANVTGTIVMNPYAHPLTPRDEFYTWPEVHSFNGGMLVFKK